MMKFRALLILIVFFIVTACEPLGVLEYESEEVENEEEHKTGGSSIEDYEYDIDTTVYKLKPNSIVSYK